MEPQRPWAWSQLPDEVLCGLARFRSDPLNEKILDNAFVHEMVQAALAELETTDRELMTHRYCHLDTEEHIAEEMNCSIEDAQNRLYRSRHSFRRTFFQLIASANSGFTESSDTGDIEVQDTNLEKLLSTTTIYQTLDNAQTDTIREQLLQAAEETAQSLPKETQQPWIFMVGIVLVIIVTLITGLYWIAWNNNSDTPPHPVSKTDTPRQSSQDESVERKAKPTTQDEIGGKELERVDTLGQTGNIDALLEILKSGQYASQRIAAPFIGELADPSAIDLLQQAEEQHYSKSLGENPFADAIEQILIRFPDAIPAVVVEEPKTKPKAKSDAEKKTKSPPAVIPAVTGRVSNFSDQPVLNATLELITKASKKIASAKTDPNGYYQFPNISYNGLASLTCRPAPPNSHTYFITQSMWCKRDMTCTINLGGRPALTGAISIDGNPLSDKTLYLSDTLDITDASFSEEVVTDSEGNFSFLGIAPDSYLILYMGLDNRLHRLTTIEMPKQDMFNVNLDIKTATVLLDYPLRPEESNAFRAVLVYALDIPESLSQIQATLAEDGSIVFEKVLPGSYVLKTQLSGGIWLQQDVEITGGPSEQIVHLDPAPEETAILGGHFLNAAPVDLFLTTVNRKIHIDITPSANGDYELTDIPGDIYSIAAFVKGQLVEFMQIDLQTEPEVILDIDPMEMMRAFSPLTVVVTDTSGIILSDAQVWLTETGGENLVTASTTGQGAFLAAPAGQYTLSVALTQYPTENRKIILEPSSLLADPEPENTILVQIPRKSY